MAGRPSKGDRKNYTLRLPAGLHRDLSHYSLDKDEDLSEILARVIGEWWENQPEKAIYKTAHDATKAANEPKKKAGKNNS